MICPNCKTENTPASPQCVHCGFSLRSGTGRPVPELPPLPPLPEDEAASAPLDPVNHALAIKVDQRVSAHNQLFSAGLNPKPCTLAP